MNRLDELSLQIAAAQRARVRAELDRDELRRTIEDEGEPLWSRLKLRRVQNSFGEEYELSLIPRVKPV